MQAAELNALTVPGPQLRKQFVDLWTREGDDHERRLGQIVQRRADESRRQHITPVQIFED